MDGGGRPDGWTKSVRGGLDMQRVSVNNDSVTKLELTEQDKAEFAILMKEMQE